MTVLLWALLVLGVVCTCAVLIGMIVSAIVHKVTRSGSATGLDWILTAMMVVTIFIDAIAAFAGLFLATVVLDDPGDRTLAAALGSVPAVVVTWFGGLVLIGRVISLANARRLKR
jgi:hypothetical protein